MSIISNLLTILFMLMGTFFLVVAGVGIIRMPDTYLRLSATTKAATLGVSSMLVAAIFHFGTLVVTSQLIVTILFVILTAPVASHVIGRASYFSGVKTWHKTSVDDLKENYRLKNTGTDGSTISGRRQ